jgi:hypothetical protein
MCHHYARDRAEEQTTDEPEESDLFEEKEPATGVELLTDGGDEDED